jgi:hypothetical protein
LKRKGRNDAAPSGIGEQFDSRAVSSWHNVSVDLITAGAIMPAAALSAVVAPSGPSQGEPLAAKQSAATSFRLVGTIDKVAARADGSPPGADGIAAGAGPAAGATVVPLGRKHRQSRLRGRPGSWRDGRSAWAEPSTDRRRGLAAPRSGTTKRRAAPGSAWR